MLVVLWGNNIEFNISNKEGTIGDEEQKVELELFHDASAERNIYPG